MDPSRGQAGRGLDEAVAEAARARNQEVGRRGEPPGGCGDLRDDQRSLHRLEPAGEQDDRGGGLRAQPSCQAVPGRQPLVFVERAEHRWVHGDPEGPNPLEDLRREPGKVGGKLRAKQVDAVHAADHAAQQPPVGDSEPAPPGVGTRAGDIGQLPHVQEERLRERRAEERHRALDPVESEDPLVDPPARRSHRRGEPQGDRDPGPLARAPRHRVEAQATRTQRLRDAEPAHAPVGKSEGVGRRLDEIPLHRDDAVGLLGEGVPRVNEVDRNLRRHGVVASAPSRRRRAHHSPSRMGTKAAS